MTFPDSWAALCPPTDFVARGRVGFARPQGATLPAHRFADMVSRDPMRPGPLRRERGTRRSNVRDSAR